MTLILYFRLQKCKLYLQVFGIQHLVCRLALSLALNGHTPSALFVIAVVCSSWSAVNLATSQRDYLTPFGDTSLATVRAGNRMVARTGCKLGKQPLFKTFLENALFLYLLGMSFQYIKSFLFKPLMLGKSFEFFLFPTRVSFQGCPYGDVVALLGPHLSD